MFEQLDSSVMDLSYSGSSVHEISVLGLRFARFKAQFIPKKFNKVADSLAHLGKFIGPKI